MITVNGIELRNLEEQVQYNADRIEAIIEGNEVLAEMGIKVVGQAAEATLLPDAATYTGDFGDAYLVGVTTPYEFYIYTRPFTGQTSPQWFLLGQFPVPGPQGPQGAIGPQGETGASTEWWTGAGDPEGVVNGKVDDLYLRLTAPNNEYNGMVYVCQGGSSWTSLSSIRGPQGIRGEQGRQGEQGEQGEQGPAGPAGPAGQSITFIGELANIDQLPDPSTVGRESAYLIPIGGVKHVFLIVGTENLQWVDAGSFGQGGTSVTVNGVFQQNWNADTKLNAATETSGNRLYCKYGATNSTISFGQSASNQLIVQRNSAGQINLPNQINVAPTDDQAISKRYTDATYANITDVITKDISSLPLGSTYGILVGAANDGTLSKWNIASGYEQYTIPRRVEGGKLAVGDPTDLYHAANKKYVDDIVIATHKVNSSYNSREGAGAYVGIAIPSNVHCKVVLEGTNTNTLADIHGFQIKDVNNATIPSFNQADVSYGDEGTFGYITISNKTYVFTVPAGGLTSYGYGGIYLIQHV